MMSANKYSVSKFIAQMKLDDKESAKNIIESLEESESVTEFALSEYSIGPEAAEAIAAALEPCINLEVVHLDNIFTSRTKEEIPVALRNFASALSGKGKIREFYIGENALGPAGVEAFLDMLIETRSILHFDINNTGLGPEGGCLIANSFMGRKVIELGSTEPSEPLKLRHFRAGRSRIEDEGAVSLGNAFAEMKTLEHVEMPQNGIGREGIAALAKGLEQNKDLRCLILKDNTLCSEGGESLGNSLTFLTSLEHLDLGDCLLTTEGLNNLIHGLKLLTELKFLDLSYNELDDGGLERLVNEVLPVCNKLERLELNGNEFSKNGLSLLTNTLRSLDKVAILGEMDENDSGSEEESGEEDGEEKEVEKETEKKVSTAVDDDADIEVLTEPMKKINFKE